MVGPLDTSAIALDQRHTEAWEWRIKGATPDQIAVQMGVSCSTVTRYLNAAMDARALPDRVQQLRLELDRLDRYQHALDDEIDNCGPYELARLVEVGVKLMERRARLLGLDAPEQLYAAWVAAGPQDLEVTQLIEAARDRVKQREQAWRDR